MKYTKVKITDVVDGKAESPLPLEVIPNYMGINLCSVDSIEWIEHEDTQIEKLTINFIPNMENKPKQTAMQELIDRLSKIMNSSIRPSNYPPRFLIEDIIEGIAKPLLEKEERQIKDAWIDGDNSDCLNEQDSSNFAEQYYNETYGGNK